MSLTYPTGLRPSLKPRRDDLRGRFRRFRDRPSPSPSPWVEPDQDDRESPPIESWDSILEAGTQPDWSKFITRLKNQKSNNSCGAEATTQAIEIVRRMRGMPYVELNPLSLYHYSSDGRDNGSGIDENLVYAQDKGIVPEHYRARDEGFTKSINEANQETALDYRAGESYDTEDVNDFAASLMTDGPVVFGWEAHAVCAVKLLKPFEGLHFIKAAGSWGNWVDRWEAERRYRVSEEFKEYLRSEITPGYHLLSVKEPEIDRYGAWSVRTVTWDE